LLDGLTLPRATMTVESNPSPPFGGNSVHWISSNGDFCSKDTQLLLAGSEEKFLVSRTDAEGVKIFNVQTGRLVSRVKDADENKIDRVWISPASAAGQDDDDDDERKNQVLALTNKHLLAIQIPTGVITSKIAHPSHFKVPDERRDVKIVVNPATGQLERVYYVIKEEDKSYWLHSSSPLAKKKAIKFGQVNDFQGRVLYGCNGQLVVRACPVVQGQGPQGQTKLAFMTEDGYVFDHHKFSKARPVTCIAVHPTDPVVATGDKSGQISVWRRNNNSGDSSSSSTSFFASKFHWHSLPVRCLAWAAGGVAPLHLYSGGDEGAILKWDTKECRRVGLVPRLGAGIVNIVNTEEHVVLATQHNVVKVLTSGLDQTSTMCGLSVDPQKPLFWHSGLQNLAVMSGERRQVQLYDPLTKNEKLSLDVSSVNRILGERGGRDNVVENEDIDFALSDCGTWLATVETNWDSMGGNCLKIWRHNLTNNDFVLNTRINQPHSEPPGATNFVQLRGQPALLTCGRSKAKLWRWAADTSDTWEPLRSFVYLGKRPTCCAQSPDGSVLAIAFGDSLTLWNAASDASSFALITSLSVQSGVIDDYASLLFGRSAANSHLLFGSTKGDASVVVWDLLTNRLIRRLTGVGHPRLFAMGAKVGVIHANGVARIGADFGVEALVSGVSVGGAVYDAVSGRLYFVSGSGNRCKLGFVNVVRQNAETTAFDEKEDNDLLYQRPKAKSGLDNAMRTKLEASAQRNIFYAKVNSNFMTPEVIANRPSSISSILVKKSLPL